MTRMTVIGAAPGPVPGPAWPGGLSLGDSALRVGVSWSPPAGRRRGGCVGSKSGFESETATSPTTWSQNGDRNTRCRRTQSALRLRAASETVTASDCTPVTITVTCHGGPGLPGGQAAQAGRHCSESVAWQCVTFKAYQLNPRRSPGPAWLACSWLARTKPPRPAAIRKFRTPGPGNGPKSRPGTRVRCHGGRPRSNGRPAPAGPGYGPFNRHVARDKGPSPVSSLINTWVTRAAVHNYELPVSLYTFHPTRRAGLRCLQHSRKH